MSSRRGLLPRQEIFENLRLSVYPPKLIASRIQTKHVNRQRTGQESFHVRSYSPPITPPRGTQALRRKKSKRSRHPDLERRRIYYGCILSCLETLLWFQRRSKSTHTALNGSLPAVVERQCSLKVYNLFFSVQLVTVMRREQSQCPPVDLAIDRLSVCTPQRPRRNVRYCAAVPAGSPANTVIYALRHNAPFHHRVKR